MGRMNAHFVGLIALVIVGMVGRVSGAGPQMLVRRRHISLLAFLSRSLR